MDILAPLVLLIPVAGFLVNALFGRLLPRRVVGWVGAGSIGLAFVLALVILSQVLGGQKLDQTYFTWWQSGDFNVPFNLYVDALSTLMILVISGVGFLIHVYSIGYMGEDAGFSRFFAYMNLFVFSMLLLVLSGNLVWLIIGWALVGLSSYLLIGFWFERHSAVLAARKAFVMNTIGDVGMVFAAFLIFLNLRVVDFQGLFGRVHQLPKGGTIITAICLLLLVGAVAKSAQLPLHTWLPDAMEGPTPVSALIHAATMVTAGVYLVGRMHPIYDVAVYAHGAVAIVGAVTALFAATIAIVQTDIKRVLAYSTMSQIGYMFLAVGIGAYSAGFFHLLSHAFFKALLFMAAGNVIHAMNDEQDMRKYGGLLKQLPRTSWSFLIGSLSLVGVIPFVGFFSKEQILGAAFSKPDASLALAVWAFGFITALVTGFYTGRMWWMSFAGKPSPERPVEHPHEAPSVMLIPVFILAALATIGGFIQTRALGFGPHMVDDFLQKAVGAQPWEGGASEVIASLVTMALAAVLFLAAYRVYIQHAWKPWSTVVPWAQRLLERKYYFDELYDAIIVRPMDALASGGLRYVEDPIIGGIVTGTGDLAEAESHNLSLTETGYFRNYVLVFVAGAVVVAILILARAGS